MFSLLFLLRRVSWYVKHLFWNWKVCYQIVDNGLQVCSWMYFASQTIWCVYQMVPPSGFGGGWGGSSAGAQPLVLVQISLVELVQGWPGSSSFSSTRNWELSSRTTSSTDLPTNASFPAKSNCPSSEFPWPFLIAASQHLPPSPLAACLSYLPGQRCHLLSPGGPL